MQKSFLRLALAMAFAASAPSFAQLQAANTALNLPLALQRAASANPELAVALREVQAQEGLLRQAGLIPNPELAISLEDTQKATRTSSMQLNQAIELGGKRSARQLAGERSRDLALAELAIKQAEIRASVVANFYDLLIAQERHTLAVSSAGLAAAVSQATAKRVQLGKISPLEATKARIAESAVSIELAQARAELNNAGHKLVALWGGSWSELEVLDAQASRLPRLPELSDLLAGLSRSPLWLRAHSQLQRRLALEQLERSRQTGDLTLSVGVKRDQQIGRNQATFGVAMPLPLFDRNQGNLQESLSRTGQARDELAALEIRLKSELAQLHQRLLVARQETKLMQSELLPGAQSAYEAALTGFEYGKFNYLDVLDAQRTLQQAKAQYLRAMAETHRAGAEITRLTGEVLIVADTQ
jgi:cobalt-zinc-cadmium efflux system outer membrane protein